MMRDKTKKLRKSNHDFLTSHYSHMEKTSIVSEVQIWFSIDATEVHVYIVVTSSALVRDTFRTLFQRPKNSFLKKALYS